MEEQFEVRGEKERAGNVVFRPVRTGNAFEETVERILQAIKLGMLCFGDRLPPERELAERLKISRVTLREAMRSLAREGYVESRRGRYGGTFVTYRAVAPQPDDLRRVAEDMGAELVDALTFREVLEVGAAVRAAMRSLSGEQRAYLQRRLTEVQEATPDGYRQADSRFHLAIAELAGSHSLTASIAETRMRLNDLLGAIPVLEHNITHSSTQHRAIVAAILGGDADGARRATEEHLSATASLLHAFLG